MASKTKIELVVAADEPALFYSSVQQAEMDLEAVDVRDGVFPIAYGPDGQIFKLEAIGDRVRITQAERVAPKPDNLRSLLLRYLSATGLDEISESEPLGSLLARCDAAAG